MTWELPPEPVARGGQGAVYFTTAPDGTDVAVKVAAIYPSAVEAVRQEGRILRALAEAGVGGVVTCLDTPEIDGQPALVMPRYASTLWDWLEAAMDDPGPATLREALEHTARLAEILGEVHRVEWGGRSLIHRDVKPENVFLDAEGGLFLGDFGAAMVIDGLRELELALYGTPMWAPFDQVLPGRAIPDPTWDTYAVCVLLYAALTGTRPAYQADPCELLTHQGRALWDLGQRAVAATGDSARPLRQAFAEERYGASAADLVDLTGRAALTEADRETLVHGVYRLAGLAGLSEHATSMLHKGLWGVLVRGLSPVAHPSPPNRFRDGTELAELLRDLADLTRAAAATPEPTPRLESLLHLGPMQAPDIPIDDEPSEIHPVLRRRPSLAVPVAGALLLVALSAGWFFGRRVLPPGGAAEVPAGTAQLDAGPVEVAAFSLDRREVSVADWARCANTGGCPPRAGEPSHPVTGLSLAEAEAYCRWAGGRLPTEAEWLLAVGDGTWPWGEAEPTCAHAVALGCDGPAPAGTRPDGATAEGIRDLAGNAWEWVRTGDGGGALRGGAADSPTSELGRAGRWEPAELRPALAGVRCAGL